MKKMMNWAAAAAGLILVACGGSDDGAKKALQGYLEDMKNQDYAAVVEGMYIKGISAEEKEVYTDLIEEKATELNEQYSGVKEYVITGDSVIVPDSLSIVFFDIVYNNGEKEAADQKMVKVEGKWMMSDGK